MKATKVRVGKGRTSRPSEQEEWVREYYELEVEIADDRELPDAKNWALAQIDSWLSGAPAAPEYIPHLDIAEVNELVWTAYKTKEKAAPGQAAWTFSDPGRHDLAEHRGVVEELVKAIRASPNGKLELGDMDYSLSGKDGQFISRRPRK